MNVTLISATPVKPESARWVIAMMTTSIAMVAPRSEKVKVSHCCVRDRKYPGRLLASMSASQIDWQIWSLPKARRVGKPVMVSWKWVLG